MKTEAHSHQWMWRAGQMDINFKRYPFALLLGLSLAIHLLALLIWPVLQPQHLALPAADFSIHLQHNDIKTESTPAHPSSSPATVPASKPVSVAALLRTTSSKAHEARQTVIKPEPAAKTAQLEATTTTNTLRPSPASSFKAINDPAASGQRIRSAGSPSGEHVRLMMPAGRKPHLLSPSPTTSPEPLAKTVSEISQNRVISRLQLELKQYFYYPRLAQRKNIQGTVILGFAINLQGQINNIRILKSSGFAILDMAAEDALQKLQQLNWDQERDRSYLQRDNSNIKLPVIYKLTES